MIAVAFVFCSNMRFNILTPKENFIFTIKLSAHEILNRISENLEPKRTGRLLSFNRNNQKIYEGYISEKTFRINEITVGKLNSFLPVLTGRIVSENNGCIIEVRMEPQQFFEIFMKIWLSIVGFVCCVIILKGILSG